jgi:hypothetical protein
VCVVELLDQGIERLLAGVGLAVPEIDGDDATGSLVVGRLAAGGEGAGRGQGGREAQDVAARW